MKKIEITAKPHDDEKIEYQFSKFNLPFQKQLVKMGDEELNWYSVIAPDDTTRKVIQPISDLLDTTQRNIFIITHDLDASFSTYLKKIEEEQKTAKVPRLTEEFHKISEPTVKFRLDLWAMILISSTVALIGLFLNNVTLIIGAMLLAPLLGPVISFSFNVAVARPKKMLKAAVNGFTLIVSAVLISALLTFIASNFMDLEMTEEIALRTEVSAFMLVLAILLGIAGGVAMSSDLSGMLVGVAVAAALIPPAAVAGIGIAFVDYEMFSGASILLASNIIGLILGVMIVLFFEKISPREFYEQKQSKKYFSLSIVSFIAMFVILWFLIF